MVAGFRSWLGDYLSNPDPLAEFAGKVALIVAFNQPFYPLYLHAIVGSAAWPAWLTLLSTPLFVAVPYAARHHSIAGRALLPIAGVMNTILCVKLFGAASGVELFFIPCVLLAAIIFRSDERLVSVPLLGLPFASYLFGDSRLGEPLMTCSGFPSIVALNGTSSASLVALVGLLFSSRASFPRS